MNSKPSERRLIENEVVFRQLNEQIQKGIEEVNKMASEDGQPEYMIHHGPDDMLLHFYCECSNVNCVDRVGINLHEYNKIHEDRDQFVVLAGHEAKKVEDIVRREKGFVVVKKHITPPDTVTELRPLHST